MSQGFKVPTKAFFAMQNFLNPGVSQRPTLNYMYYDDGKLYACHGAYMFAVMDVDAYDNWETFCVLPLVGEPKKIGSEVMDVEFHLDGVLYQQFSQTIMPYPEGEYRLDVLQEQIAAEEPVKPATISNDMLKKALSLINKCGKPDRLKIETYGGSAATRIKSDDPRIAVYIMPYRE